VGLNKSGSEVCGRAIGLNSLAIFVPSYNAARTLPDIFGRIPEDLWPTIAAIFVINDGSDDDTEDVVRKLARRWKKIRLVSHQHNSGYGAAVREGLRCCAEETNANFIACLHADGQYPPEELPRFAKYMAQNEIDIIQGSRHKDGTALAGGMPKYKWLAGKVLTAMENWSFGLQMTDYHSGFLLYSRKAVRSLPFIEFSNYFDFDLEVIASARALGLSLAELGIPTRYAGERSHLNVVRYGFRCLRVMLRYRLGCYQIGSTNW